MNSMATKWFFLAAFALGGCAVDASLDVPSVTRNSTGSLTQRWSIGGRFDRSLCRAYGADRMELVIRDQTGRLVARAYQPCEEMEMTLTLAIGSYVGDAVLIAGDGSSVSTTLQLQPFRILRDTDTFIDTDFPISSLLTVLDAPEEPVDEDQEVDEESP